MKYICTYGVFAECRGACPHARPHEPCVGVGGLCTVRECVYIQSHQSISGVFCTSYNEGESNE